MCVVPVRSSSPPGQQSHVAAAFKGGSQILPSGVAHQVGSQRQPSEVDRSINILGLLLVDGTDRADIDTKEEKVI